MVDERESRKPEHRDNATVAGLLRHPAALDQTDEAREAAMNRHSRVLAELAMDALHIWCVLPDGHPKKRTALAPRSDREGRFTA
jgi:hypothetical protein